jgi:cytochrome c553
VGCSALILKSYNIQEYSVMIGRIVWLWLVLGVFPSYLNIAEAEEPVSITLTFQPDLRNGRAIYETCAACHLPEGWGSEDGTYPQIAGQHLNFLLKQLLDIREGRRENPVMYPFVQQRTIGGYQSLVDVVAYIAKLPMHPHHQKGPDNDSTPQYKNGEKLFKQHCAVCHGTRAAGNNTQRIPKLRGQHYPYMMRQIDHIKTGLRVVDPAMKAIVDQMTDDNLKDIINYVSYIPVPEAERAPSLNWRNPDFN